MTREDISRAVILDAADALFHKWGLHKTTMEDIAREAGKSKCTLYHYYKNKEDVLEALAQSHIMKSIAMARKDIEKTVNCRDKIRLYFYISLNEMRRMSVLNDVLHQEIHSNKGLIKKISKFHDEQEAEVIGSILREGKGTGEFRGLEEKDIPAAARAMMLIKRSLALNMFMDSKDRESIDIIMKWLSAGFCSRTGTYEKNGLPARMPAKMKNPSKAETYKDRVVKTI